MVSNGKAIARFTLRSQRESTKETKAPAAPQPPMMKITSKALPPSSPPQPATMAQRAAGVFRLTVREKGKAAAIMARDAFDALSLGEKAAAIMAGTAPEPEKRVTLADLGAAVFRADNAPSAPTSKEAAAVEWNPHGPRRSWEDEAREAQARAAAQAISAQQAFTPTWNGDNEGSLAPGWRNETPPPWRQPL